MNSPPATKTNSERTYQFELPTPRATLSLASGMEMRPKKEILRSLSELQQGLGDLELIIPLCDRVISRFPIGPAKSQVADTNAAPNEVRSIIYDRFFDVERASNSVGKNKILETLVRGLAIVMLNTFTLEGTVSRISQVEFGLLHQSFAVIIESLQEVSDSACQWSYAVSATCPIKKIKQWLRRLKPRYKDPSKYLTAIVEPLDSEALKMWRQGHQLFFVLIQAATLELQLFINCTNNQDLDAAKRHLNRASMVMLGSAASMRIAGDVDQNSYQQIVVPAMLAAHPKFTGSISPDHGILVERYKAIGARKDLPVELHGAYDRFLLSVSTALAAHTSVCAFHRGGQRSSTGSGSSTKLTGIETLRRIGAYWLKLLRNPRSSKKK
jgi:hypothetical protein